MLSYNIYCRASKRDRQGLSPIEINIKDGVRRVVIVSDFKYDALKFEKERRMRKSNRAKEIVGALMNEVTDRIIELKKNGIDVTPSNIKRYFRGVPGADVYMLRTHEREDNDTLSAAVPGAETGLCDERNQLIKIKANYPHGRLAFLS